MTYNRIWDVVHGRILGGDCSSENVYSFKRMLVLLCNKMRCSSVRFYHKIMAGWSSDQNIAVARDPGFVSQAG